MKITIVGAGQVGTHLAKYLSAEHQDVHIADSDPAKLQMLDSDFNLMTVVGMPTEFRTLRNAATPKADIFIAVTPDTSENIVACAMAKSMGAKMTVARVDRYDFIMPDNAEVMRKMGVDRIIFPELLAADAIINALDHSWCSNWYEFEGSSIVMAAVTLPADSPLAGKRLRDMDRADSNLLHISALRRNHSTIIPHGEHMLLPGDTLYFTATPAGIPKILQLTAKTDRPVKRVLIMGGSRMAETIILRAGKKYSFTVIENNLERCRELTLTCPDCDIICGDASEQDVLEEAGFDKADAFIALSGTAESNILACITAKEAGIWKTMAEVEREQFINQAEAFEISTIINKQLIASNTIFQLMLDADSSNPKCLVVANAEVARLEIKAGAWLTSAPVRELAIPHEITFAGYIRDGIGYIVNGNTRFIPGDTVLVFCLSGALNKVEKLFSR